VPKSRGRIIVAAGTNGAGKSSIAGEYLSKLSGAYFNPDIAAKTLVKEGKSQQEANAIAWRTGFDALQRAIDLDRNFTFETTLGGESIVAELKRAVRQGLELWIFYVGLDSVETHIERVRARVARGGHDIPEAKIRERYRKSLAHLIGLIGMADRLVIFDNSEESPAGRPIPKLVLRMVDKRIVEPSPEECVLQAPEWAKPIVGAAMSVHFQKQRSPKTKR